uniref:Uncharacterized protein n=1 Tax=Arundo donax TaxID=35708 RepID=A0A0A9EF33_ARUDO
MFLFVIFDKHVFYVGSKSFFHMAFFSS